MRRSKVSLVIALVVAITGITLAQTTTAASLLGKTNLDPCVSHPHPAHEQQALAQRTFALRNWKSPKPGPGRVAQMQVLRQCAKPKALPAMRKSWRTAKKRLYRYHTLRQVAPFPGYTGYGMGLRWLAVPRNIVDCEGGPDWNRPNSQGSGAWGPYQLLGHGEPIPVETWHDQIITHRIAGSLYASEGTGPWVSSQSCWG